MDDIKVKKARKRKRQKAKNKEKPEFNQVEMEKQSEKSKEQILAERQAKKAAKKVVKSSPDVKKPTTNIDSSKKSPVKVDSPVKSPPHQPQQPEKPQDGKEKTREQIIAEREAKKQAKLAGKKKSDDNQAVEQKKPLEKKNSDTVLSQEMQKLHISDPLKSEKSIEIPEKKVLTKAERRAIQEAQRAAKAKALEEKTKPPVKVAPSKPKKEIKATPTPQKQPSSSIHKVKLFKHLYTEKCDLNLDVNGPFHPAIVKLGIQYANDVIVGSNSRCYAFLNALKILINDFVTPHEKVFSRALEAEIQKSVEFLQKCRPLAVSMTNALKHIKLLISQENSTDSDEKKKERITSRIETYAQEEIETAARSISLKVCEKISEDDVILTFGCSSLIKRSLVESWKNGGKKFSVVVVDSRPDHEGQAMLKSLTREGISCTYILINAISFIMPKVTKVLLGAHALLANGYVMSRVGTAQISMVANYFNVPVLICCETHKFSERVQTDSFVYNELGDPNALVWNKNSKSKFDHLKDWESIPHLTPLNLRYDITPPELITAVVTEVALLPCTSVQVILRVKPTE